MPPSPSELNIADQGLIPIHIHADITSLPMAVIICLECRNQTVVLEQSLIITVNDKIQ